MIPFSMEPLAINPSRDFGVWGCRALMTKARMFPGL